MRNVLIVISLILTIGLQGFSSNPPVVLPQKDFVVVLDAGHGGHDPGNLGNGFLEKNIALAVVLKLGALLEQQPGIRVIYTRDDDTFIGLEERGAIANKANADLFVSIHCNAHGSDVEGTETFVLGLNGNEKNFEVAKKENSVIYLEDNYEKKYSQYNISSPEFVIGSSIMQEEFLDQSVALASNIQNQFTKTLGRKDRKVKQAAFVVLHQTFMPSVLVELGFLTNKSEGLYLNGKKGQDEMALAIANAILSYKDGVDANILALSDISKNPPKENNPVPPKPIESTVTDDKITEATSKSPSSNASSTKQVSIENKEIRPQITENDAVVFKVQLVASSKELELTSQNFKGLDNITKEPYNGLFRYLYGSTSNYTKAQDLQKIAKSRGYASAYIVAYKNGNRVPLSTVIN